MYINVNIVYVNIYFITYFNMYVVKRHIYMVFNIMDQI